MCVFYIQKCPFLRDLTGHEIMLVSPPVVGQRNPQKFKPETALWIHGRRQEEAPVMAHVQEVIRRGEKGGGRIRCEEEGEKRMTRLKPLTNTPEVQTA